MSECQVTVWNVFVRSPVAAAASSCSRPPGRVTKRGSRRSTPAQRMSAAEVHDRPSVDVSTRITPSSLRWVRASRNAQNQLPAYRTRSVNALCGALSPIRRTAVTSAVPGRVGDGVIRGGLPVR
ncbi:hypothetical protein NKG94_10160 [Micromonospora sp. M12]